MKKRFLSVVLIGVLSASLCACGGNKTKVVDSSKVETSETKEKVTETAETEHEYTDEEIRELTIDYFTNKVTSDEIAEKARKFYALSLMETIEARQVKVTDSDLPFLADDFRFIDCSDSHDGLNVFTLRHSDGVGLLDTNVVSSWLSSEPNGDGYFVGDCTIEIIYGNIETREVYETYHFVVSYTLMYDVKGSKALFLTIEDRGHKGVSNEFTWGGEDYLSLFLTDKSPLIGEYSAEGLYMGKSNLDISYDTGLVFDGSIEYLDSKSERSWGLHLDELDLKNFFISNNGNTLSYYINLSECEELDEPTLNEDGTEILCKYVYKGSNNIDFLISIVYFVDGSDFYLTVTPYSRELSDEERFYTFGARLFGRNDYYGM